MPVTLQVSPHSANSYSMQHRYQFDLSTPFGILQSISTNDFGRRMRISDININKASVIQSSITAEDIPLIDPIRNGFVLTCVTAYSKHYNLVLRPEDVWFAILAQFNFYVNAHAEEMKEFFVEHQGKKELEVIATGTRNTVDWGWLAEMCSELIKKNIKDPSIHTWILPSFSTTTTNDTAIASILMMSTLKSYFSYKFSLECGIPSVTLLGEKSDWESLLQRVSIFSTVFNKNNKNPELAKFEQLLTPVLKNFIKTFEAPIDAQATQCTKQFWSKICHRIGGGSGPSYLTGWLTAFCVFSNSGKWQGEEDEEAFEYYKERLVLEQVVYPLIDICDIPQSWAAVDVIVDDNGNKFAGKMVAGLIGTKAAVALSDGANKAALESESTFGNIRKGPILGDTISPYSAWFMVNKGQGAKPDETEYPKAEPLYAGFGRRI